MKHHKEDPELERLVAEFVVRWYRSLKVLDRELGEQPQDINVIQSIFAKSVDYLGNEFSNPRLVNWRRVRGLIEHENNLVHNRITWLFTSHIALLSAFAALAAILFNKNSVIILGDFSFNTGIVVVPIFFISLLGVAFSFNTYSNIAAAHQQIDRATRWWISEKFPNTSPAP